MKAQAQVIITLINSKKIELDGDEKIKVVIKTKDKEYELEAKAKTFKTGNKGFYINEKIDV